MPDKSFTLTQLVKLHKERDGCDETTCLICDLWKLAHSQAIRIENCRVEHMGKERRQIL